MCFNCNSDVVWFVQLAHRCKGSCYLPSCAVMWNEHTLTLSYITVGSAYYLRVRTNKFTLLSSFELKSNQQREHWKPIRCSFFHVRLFDFAFSKQTICQTIAANITKKQECWFGVSSSQEARDVMAAIMYSLILTAANGRETSKWLWTGTEGRGVRAGNSDIMGLF